jgi:predicted esterase
MQEEWIGIPILAGNGLSDPSISYKGTEQLEKAKIKAGFTDSVFMYFNNAGHEVTEAFMMKVIPFLNKTF